MAIIAGLCFTSAAQAQLSIRPTVTLDVQTDPTAVQRIESSTNLTTWSDLTSHRGSGEIQSITVDSEGKQFFRLDTESYPQLSDVDVLGSAQGLTPEFSPSVYRYYFRESTNAMKLRFHFNVPSVRSARLNGNPIEAGAEISASGTNRMRLELLGTNNLVTVYAFERMPSTFPTIVVTNHLPSDPGNVILLGVKGGNASKGVGASTFVAAVDDHGVPYWWKDIQLGHNLKLHDTGLVGYTRLMGTNSAGERLGEHVVMDRGFNDLFSLTTVGDPINDNHDVFMTERGTYYILGYLRTNRMVATAGGETNTPFKDGIVQEITTATRELLFEWNTWPDLEYTNALYTIKDDYAHLNWVREDFDGNLLISARAQSQVVKVNRRTGDVMWSLGRNGDMTFQNDPLGGFAGQHSAHRLANGNLLIFDNRNFATTNKVISSEGPSRVVEYAIDEAAKTATLVWSYSRPGFHTISNGGVQRMENGNTFISWGLSPPGFATEVDAQGQIVQDIHIVDDQNRHLLGYIAYKWKAHHFPGLSLSSYGPQ